MTIKQEIEMFKDLTTRMNEVFTKKRLDYGQSTTETYEKFGPVSMLTRMHDKMGRLDRLLGANMHVNNLDEKVEDTLLDLANYALITILEMSKVRMNQSVAREEYDM